MTIETLDEGRQFILANMDRGVKCPCCTQLVKVYRRTITAATAYALCRMQREAGTDWVHLPTILGQAHADEAKARYWGLIEKWEGERPDGSPRTGWWRLTAWGQQFVLGEVRVPKFALIYDSECHGLEGPRIGIRDALTVKFNYDSLMSGVGS